MKKLSKMVLAELGKELNEQEMKGITGGYTGSSYYDSSRCGDKILLECQCIYGIGKWTSCFVSFHSRISTTSCISAAYGGENAVCRKV